MNKLEYISSLVEELNRTNSKNDKIVVLMRHGSNETFKKLMSYMFDYGIKFNVTSDVLKKQSSMNEQVTDLDLFQLFDMLNERRITGHKAISVINGFINNFPWFDCDISFF